MPRFKRHSDRVQQLIAMLRAGNYLDVAARASDLALDDLARWAERFPELRQRIGQASAEGEARNVTRIAQAAGENWQAAAWLLERQYPERWSRPLARMTDEPGPEPTLDQLDELARKRLARRQGVE